MSGFPDALIFKFIQSFMSIYRPQVFLLFQVGLTFLSISIGYIHCLGGIHPRHLAQSERAP
jgi:hypothetical protein